MAAESPTHHAPVWLFSFVDLAFLLLIAMTQLDEGRELAVELGEIVVPRIHASAEGMPSAAAVRWQLRVHPAKPEEPATTRSSWCCRAPTRARSPRGASAPARCAPSSLRSRPPAWRGRSSPRTPILVARICSTPSASSKKSGRIADAPPWRRSCCEVGAVADWRLRQSYGFGAGRVPLAPVFTPGPFSAGESLAEISRASRPSWSRSTGA